MQILKIALFFVTLSISTVLSDKCPTPCICLNGDFRNLYCADTGKEVIIDVGSTSSLSINCEHLFQMQEKLDILSFHMENVTISNFYLHDCHLRNGSDLNVVGTQKLNKSALQVDFIQAKYWEINHTHRILRTSKIYLYGFEKVKELQLAASGASQDLFYSMMHLKSLHYIDEFFTQHIHFNFFRPLINLRRLILQGITLDNAPENMFSTLKNLKKLKLLDVTIYFTDNFFVGMDNLQEIVLMDTLGTDTIAKCSSVFRNLLKLEKLEIDTVMSKLLPAKLFINNKRLKTLYLHLYKMNTFPNMFLANLPSLEDVRLSYCGIREIPEDLLENTTNLLSLDLSENMIRMLPAKFLRTQASLVVLTLSSNELDLLPTDLFINQTQLKSLNLTSNKLSHLKAGIFDALHSLEHLELSNNHIIDVDKDVFRYNIHLKTLFLRNKMLQCQFSYSIYNNPRNGSPFKGLSRLEQLDLSQNKITSIPCNWKTARNFIYMDANKLEENVTAFKHSNELQSNLRIDLSHNLIEHIAPNAFMVGDEKVIAILEGNPIICDCLLDWYFRYHVGSESNLAVAIKVVNTTCAAPKNLRGTEVTDLNASDLLCKFDIDKENKCPKGFECTVRLYDDTIIISFIEKSEKNVGSLDNLKSITFENFELHMEHSGIADLKTYINGSIPNYVTHLYLNDNNLTSISIEHIPNKIKVIDVGNNWIERINEEVAKKIFNSKRLKSVSFIGNRVACDCYNFHFLEYLRKAEKDGLVKDYRSLKCLNGQEIYTLDTEELCRSELMPITVVFSLLMGITGMGLAFFYKYNEEIKVYLFARGWCLRWLTEDELDHDRDYDAFISFSHEDDKFVLETLVPELESEPRPYKLCFHYRDWIAGEIIMEQIATSIEKSRRTIIILSKHFLTSPWGLTEFRAAYHGKSRIIIVIYDDIDLNQIEANRENKELILYLKTTTYVKWGDPWFWRKLKYALPRPRSVDGQNPRVMAGATTNSIRNVIGNEYNFELQEVECAYEQ